MANGLTRVLFVDRGAVTPNEDGSLTLPYHSIQSAIDSIPTPTTPAATALDWTVLIAPGDYDEPLTIQGPVRLALLGLGAFRLGRYTVAGGTQANIVPEGGATPRNIEWTYDASQAVANGASAQLVIGMVGGSDTVRRGKPIANQISGSVIVRGSGWTSGTPAAGGNAFLAVSNTEIDAGTTAAQASPVQPALDAMGFDGILVDRHYHSRFRGNVMGPLSQTVGVPPAYIWAVCFMSTYEGLVQVSRYATIEQCGFAGGMTVSLVPQIDMLKSITPPGMVHSTFAGTFTGPARSLLLDAATNEWFGRNGASLSGGATKSLLGAPLISPIRDGAVLAAGDSGTIFLSRPRGPATVTLPAAGSEPGMWFTFKNISSVPIPAPPGVVTIAAASGETIDGKPSLQLGPLAAATIVSWLSEWWIVNGYPGN
jgi:hypothetical protein